MPQSPAPGLPEAPPVSRRMQLPASQFAGVLALLILPVLALAGVFGESFDRVEASRSGVRLSVVYPSRLRFRLESDLQVTVQNTGTQTLDTLAIHFERDYIDQFSSPAFIPSVTEATRDAYIVALHNLAPGASQLVAVQLRGERYGRHEGKIWVTIDNQDSQAAVDITLSSLVFP